jgi:hypothetical protein
MVPRADEVLKIAQTERNVYLNGLSDRTRTLCLGSLALIWGIFSQKKGDHEVEVSHKWKVVLLCIGLSAIVVLVLDFGEYVCAFQHRRKLAGEDVSSRIRYDTGETVMRFLKIGLGAVTLIALCIALASILATPLFALGPATYPYLGKWCGGNSSLGEYVCLTVMEPMGTLVAEFDYQGATRPLKCKKIQRVEESLVATCGQSIISAHPLGRTSQLFFTMRVGVWSGTRNLNRIE